MNAQVLQVSDDEKQNQTDPKPQQPKIKESNPITISQPVTVNVTQSQVNNKKQKVCKAFCKHCDKIVMAVVSVEACWMTNPWCCVVDSIALCLLLIPKLAKYCHKHRCPECKSRLAVLESEETDLDA